MESSELSWDAQHSGKAFLQELLICSVSCGNLDIIHTDQCSQGGSNYQAFSEDVPMALLWLKPSSLQLQEMSSLLSLRSVWQLVLWYVPVEFLYSILIVNNLRLLHNRSLDILLVCKIRLICIRISKKQMLVDRSTLSSCPPLKDGSLHQQANQVRTWFSFHIKLFLF